MKTTICALLIFPCSPLAAGAVVSLTDGFIWYPVALAVGLAVQALAFWIDAEL